MTDMMTRKVLTQELGISQSTIIRWEKEGMPVIRIGGIVRYNLEQVKQWIAEMNDLAK